MQSTIRIKWPHNEFNYHLQSDRGAGICTEFQKNYLRFAESNIHTGFGKNMTLVFLFSRFYMYLLVFLF